MSSIFRLTFLKSDEVSDEEKKAFINTSSGNSLDLNAVRENEVYQKKLETKKLTPLMAPLSGLKFALYSLYNYFLCLLIRIFIPHFCHKNM